MNTTDIPITSEETSPANDRALQKHAILGGLTALADWLFYGHTFGISAALFIVALAAVMLLLNPVQPNRRAMSVAAGVLLAALAAIVEANDILQFAIGAIALAYFAVAA